jgi:phospholipase/lecithinase/hemolysin
MVHCSRVSFIFHDDESKNLFFASIQSAVFLGDSLSDVASIRFLGQTHSGTMMANMASKFGTFLIIKTVL